MATALAYVALIALAPLVPAAISVLYALVLGGGNTQGVGFRPAR